MVVLPYAWVLRWCTFQFHFWWPVLSGCVVHVPTCSGSMGLAQELCYYIVIWLGSYWTAYSGVCKLVQMLMFSSGTCVRRGVKLCVVLSLKLGFKFG